MTLVEQHREQPRMTPPANGDLAREHGNRIDLLADIAEERDNEAERELTARTQYEDGLQVLKWLIDAPWTDRTLEIDQVLHDEHGSLSTGKAAEFIDLLLSGQSSMQARRTMLARQPRRSERTRATRSAVAGARQVSANLHHMAEVPRVHENGRPAQPALPAASAVPGSNGVPLQRRQPIAPSQPPMFPPAPPETPAQSTGHLVAVLKDETAAGATQVLSAKSLQRLRDEGFGQEPAKAVAPDFGPPAPAAFAASAVPVGMKDTARMDLRELAADGPVETDEDDDFVAPPPFATAANTAASDASPSGAASGSGDDDD